jgi:lipopolysaccharide transport system ATP-binding protein
LLEVGAGFHPDFSGRENIFLQGAVLGIKQAEIRRAFDQIVDFADIGVFIDVPVKHYSSGMFIRLAFSVALHLRTDILILDEVMAVGDAPFQQKSMSALENLVHDGRTVLFVSHSCDMVARLCNRGMLIDKGHQLYFGSADMAITHYMQMIHHLPIEASPDETDGSERKEPLAADRDLRDAPRVEGSKRHLVTRAVARAADLSPHSEFQTGDTLVIDIHCHCEDATKVYFQLSFMGMDGKRIMSVHSTHGEFALEMGGEGFARCVIPDIRLVTGEYSIMVTVGPQPDGSELSWFEHIPDALRIRVRLGSYLGGVGLQPFQGTMAQRSLWHMGAGGEG